MSGIATAAVAVGAYSQYKSGKRAAKAQQQMSEAGIEEQRRQFDAIQELLAPYVEAGTGAVGAQGALIGLQGPQAQAEAIQALEKGPAFEALTRQGEEALLQNASATGGLRGGNLQGALAQFRPQLLSQLIENQFGQLGRIGALGQASATQQAAAGQQIGANIANLLGQIGAAKAGGYLSTGNAIGGLAGGAGSLAILNQMGEI